MESKKVRNITIILFALFAFTIFVQNFVFSSNLDLLTLRTPDDVAFQSSLRTIHIAPDFDALLSMNYYGYGWIYWAFIAIITYPAFLLQQGSGVAWLLIVTPRMVSIAFALGCVYVFYKIMSVYTNNEWIRCGALFLFPIFPTQSYFAGRFGTVCPAAFFCMLSIYLVIKYETSLSRKQLFTALVAIAIAFAIKLTSVVAAPMLILLILSRYQWKFTKDNLKMWGPNILASAYIFLFLLSPAIALFPFKLSLAKQSIRNIAIYVKNTTGKISFLDNMQSGILKANYYLPVFILLLVAVAICTALSLRQKESPRRFDFCCYLSGFLIGILYLCVSIGNGAWYVSMYSWCICFVLPMGVLVFEKMNFRFKNVSIVIVICAIVVQQVAFVQQRIATHAENNPFSYFQAAKESAPKIEQMEVMRKTVQADRQNDSPFLIIVDYNQPLFWSSLSHPDICCYTLWNDLQNWEGANPDYICLSKNRIALLPEADFNRQLAQIRGKEQMLLDREASQSLVNKQQLFGHSWKVLLETDAYYIFKKV